MIKKTLLFVSVLLMMSCGSKHKLIQDEKKEIKEHVDSTAIKHDSLVTIKDSLKEDECFENTGEGEIVIERADGSKIRIPHKGAYKRSKSQIHNNILEKKESVVAIKKMTNTKKYTHKKEKDVKREPFRIPWWIWLLIATGCFMWYEWKRG